MKPPSPTKHRNSLRERFAKLLPPLSFAEPLESQYRNWHTDHVRERVKYTMLPAMGLLLIVSLAGGPFRALRESLFAPGPDVHRRPAPVRRAVADLHGDAAGDVHASSMRVG